MGNEDRPLVEMRTRSAAIDAAHERANRDALLRHAKFGEPVSTWRDGKVVWLSPAEVFAMYGLDEFGRSIGTSGA